MERCENLGGEISFTRKDGSLSRLPFPELPCSCTPILLLSPEEPFCEIVLKYDRGVVKIYFPPVRPRSEVFPTRSEAAIDVR